MIIRLTKLLFREISLTIAVLLISTFLLFIAGYYSTGERSREQLNVTKGALGSYIEWWGDVFQGNWGGQYQSSDLMKEQVWSSFKQTLELVLLALLFSVFVAICLSIFLNTYDRTIIAKAVDRSLYLSGAIPIFLIPIVIYSVLPHDNFIFVDSRMSFIENLVPFSIAAVVLSFGSGVMGELVRVLKNELGRIINEPYIDAARARGAKVWLHVTKASIIPLSSAIVSKIAYFIGAAIVIERPSGIKGLSERILEGAENTNFAKLMVVTLLLVSVVLIIRIINRIIVALIDPRAS